MYPKKYIQNSKIIFQRSNMENKIMIVESPNKVNTIQKIVGDNIKVLSSIGHILKMSTSGIGGLGIDFEN